jgi:hypothetical protein
LGLQIAVLDLLAVHQAQSSLALLDRDHLDLQLPSLEGVRRHRVGGLVDGHHLLLALGVLDRLLQPDLLDEFCLPQVVPPQRVPAIL